MKKVKIISGLLCMALCFGTFSISASAEESTIENINNTDASAYIAPEVQLQQYLARTDVSEEQKEAAIDKYNLGQALAEGNGLTQQARAAEKTLDVPWYSQFYGNYCGPASTKQTVQFLTGSSDTQDQIARDLKTNDSGTDTNEIQKYLVNKTGYAYETLWWWADASAFSNMVVSDTDAGLPIIGHVIISNKGGWPYTTTGHYLNYNGYRSSGDDFFVTDPYADRYGISKGKYWISNNEAERVTDRIVW